MPDRGFYGGHCPPDFLEVKRNLYEDLCGYGRHPNPCHKHIRHSGVCRNRLDPLANRPDGNRTRERYYSSLQMPPVLADSPKILKRRQYIILGRTFVNGRWRHMNFSMKPAEHTLLPHKKAIGHSPFGARSGGGCPKRLQGEFFVDMPPCLPWSEGILCGAGMAGTAHRPAVLSSRIPLDLIIIMPDTNDPHAHRNRSALGMARAQDVKKPPASKEIPCSTP